jgi:surfactin synthase thioesterase subunit
VTCELTKRGQMPLRLVVLSFPSPENLSHDGELNKLSDEQLVEEVDKLFGGVPEGIRQDETALKFFVPGLRFDLGLLEGYRHQATKPLQVPIVAICGTDDRAVNVAEMHRWQQMTTAAFRLRSMPGDHFFPLQRMPEILQVAVWDVLPR